MNNHNDPETLAAADVQSRFARVPEPPATPAPEAPPPPPGTPVTAEQARALVAAWMEAERACALAERDEGEALNMARAATGRANAARRESARAGMLARVAQRCFARSLPMPAMDVCEQLAFPEPEPELTIPEGAQPGNIIRRKSDGRRFVVRRIAGGDDLAAFPLDGGNP